MNEYTKISTEELTEMEKSAYSEYYQLATKPITNPTQKDLQPLEQAINKLESIREELRTRKSPSNNVVKNLIQAVADYGLDSCWNDSDVINALIDLGVTKEDFEKAGYSDFVKEYFEEEKDNKPSVDSQIQSASTRDAASLSSMDGQSHPHSPRSIPSVDVHRDQLCLSSGLKEIQCKVTFCRTAGIADHHQFDVPLSITDTQNRFDSNRKLLLTPDERIQAYDAAARLVGEENLSDYIIYAAEAIKPPLSVTIQSASTRGTESHLISDARNRESSPEH